MKRDGRAAQRIGHILIWLPTLLWAAAISYFDGFGSLISLALAAAFHECGHLLAYSSLGLAPPRLIPVARGIRLRSPDLLSYRDEAVIAAAGPAANLIGWGAGLVLGRAYPWLSSWGEMHLMLALSNLIPLSGMDGERLFACLIAGRLSDRAAYLTRRVLSFLCLFVSLFGSLCILWLTGSAAYPAFLSIGALLFGSTESEETGGKSSKTEIF